MVSISNVSVEHATNYYRRDDYNKEGLGEWHGKGISHIGLEGVIRRDDYLCIITGKDPNDGRQLVKNAGNGTHRVGVDLTFSAPKSVSVFALVIGAEKALKAHNDAVIETLKHIEKNLAQARFSFDGATHKINTGNLTIARFQHYFSRENDPQLHDHCLVLNLTKTKYGWRAISNESLYYNRMYIGQYYRSEIAKNLSLSGFPIHGDEKGFFEICGIDQQVLRIFSQRREQVKQKIQEIIEQGKYQNVDNHKRNEIATISSRRSRKCNIKIDLREVEQHWDQRLKAAGYEKEEIIGEIQRQNEKALGMKGISAKEAVKMAVIKASGQEAVFKKEDALIIAAKLTIGRHKIAMLDRSFRDCIAREEIKKVPGGKFSMEKIKDPECSVKKAAGKDWGSHYRSTTQDKVQKEMLDRGGQDRLTDTIQERASAEQENEKHFNQDLERNG